MVSGARSTGPVDLGVVTVVTSAYSSKDSTNCTRTEHIGLMPECHGQTDERTELQYRLNMNVDVP